MAGFELFGPTPRLLAGALGALAKRHEMISSNIANAETPGYRRRDLSFHDVLGAFGETGAAPARGVRPVRIEPLLLPVNPFLGLEAAAGAEEERLDRNQVRLDRELSRLVENALRYEASLVLLSRKLAGLRYAIEEGRR
jgi:flagellar basal-body rod protein FlgB